MFDKTRVMAIAKRLMDGEIDAPTFYAEITRCLAEEAGCTRASLWRYPDPLMRDSIECLGLWDRTESSFSAGLVLKDEDFGSYFEAMRRDNLIVASDARKLDVTRCFNEIGGEPFGLFCLENTTDVLNWTPQHLDYLRAVGTLLGFALKKARRGDAVPA
jgi:hypothetical protein